MFVSRTLTSISYFSNFVLSRIRKHYTVPLQIHQYVAMLDNGHSLVVEGCKLTLPAAERSFKSITGMVELVRGIVLMGSA
jgi:ribose 1,5-bisphosphokinase PhnN